MATGPELERITPNLFVWYRYDSSVKAELFSTGIRSGPGWWLIDPIDIGRAILDDVVNGAGIAGIIVTNANHSRGAPDLSHRLGVSVHAHPDAHSEVGADVKLNEHTAIPPDLEIIPLAGAPAGEIAVFSADDGGTLVVGDALINMDGYAFTFLPAKYCDDAKLMRKSLRQLLNFEFERLLFAHGTPIVSAARGRLEALLEGGA